MRFGVILSGVMGRRAQQPVGPDVWAVCRGLIPAGSVFAFLAEHRDEVFPESMFEDLYPSPNGRPSVPPQVLAVATVLQVLTGASDYEAVDLLRCDLRWKAACGLGLNDPGFDPSLFVYFRRRLAASGDRDRLFTRVRQVIEATGILKGRRRRALDSTVFDDAVASQDTVTQLVAAIRAVIRLVPGAAPVAAEHCHAHDYADPGKPRIAWNDEQARAVLVDGLVTDALNLLGRLPDRELDEPAANAVGILALVAGQDVEFAEGSDGTDGRWRIAQRTAPGRMVSTVDPEARHIHKTRSRYQSGFKGHVAAEPETGLFTAVQMRSGCGADNHEAAVAPELLADEQPGLSVLGDSAYGGGEFRDALIAAEHLPVVKPPPLKPAVPGGFTLDDFDIDTAAGEVTCPAGHTVPLSAPGGRFQQRRAVFAGLCADCPLRARCTTAKTGRVVTIRPQHDQQAAARQQAATDTDWQHEYRTFRPMIERGIAWLTRGSRSLRYRGVVKNDAWLHNRAAALNLRRLINLGLDHTDDTWTITPATP
jgi:IS5 family transposase